MSRLVFASLALACAVMSGCATLPQRPASPTKVELVVIGDPPYDAADEAMLAHAAPAIKALQSPFVLHVGAMQSSRSLCGPPDDRFAALQAAWAPTPIVYTPGDNEWSDCDTKDDVSTGARFS